MSYCDTLYMEHICDVLTVTHLNDESLGPKYIFT